MSLDQPQCQNVTSYMSTRISDTERSYCFTCQAITSDNTDQYPTPTHPHVMPDLKLPMRTLNRLQSEDSKETGKTSTGKTSGVGVSGASGLRNVARSGGRSTWVELDSDGSCKQ